MALVPPASSINSAPQHILLQTYEGTDRRRLEKFSLKTILRTSHVTKENLNCSVSIFSTVAMSFTSM